MRCPKCGNEIEQKGQNCSSCGTSLKGATSNLTADDKMKSYIDSIKNEISNSPDTYKSSGNTGKLKNNTGKLNTNTNSTPTSSWLPKAFADLPFAQTKVSPIYAVLLLIFLPLIGLLGYFWSTNQICVGCENISGRYTTNLIVDDKEIQLELVVLQFSRELNGQVFLRTKVAPVVGTVPTPIPTNTPKIRQVAELIKQTYLDDKKIHLETYPKADKNFALDFSGQYLEDHTLQGDIILDFPSLSISNRKIAVTLTKLQ